jgi:hypothetical protein
VTRLLPAQAHRYDHSWAERDERSLKSVALGCAERISTVRCVARTGAGALESRTVCCGAAEISVCAAEATATRDQSELVCSAGLARLQGRRRAASVAQARSSRTARPFLRGPPKNNTTALRIASSTPPVEIGCCVAHAITVQVSCVRAPLFSKAGLRSICERSALRLSLEASVEFEVARCAPPSRQGHLESQSRRRSWSWRRARALRPTERQHVGETPCMVSEI